MADDRGPACTVPLNPLCTLLPPFFIVQLPSRHTERTGSGVRATPRVCLFSLRGNKKVAHWAMTVCLVNVGHLEREDGPESERETEGEIGQRGNWVEFLADRQRMFPHGKAPSYSPARKFHRKMTIHSKAVLPQILVQEEAKSPQRLGDLTEKTTSSE